MGTCASCCSSWCFSWSRLVKTSLEKLEKLQPPWPSNCSRWVWNLARAGRWVMVRRVTPASLAACSHMVPMMLLKLLRVIVSIEIR